jgi:carbamoyltransferase
MSRSDELIISAYGSHNATISMFYKGKYTVVEVERWLNRKNAGLANYNPVQNIQLVFDQICDYLFGLTDRSEADVYISGYMGQYKPKFFYKKHLSCDHHMAHAATAFYQSPYKEALIYTYDGGGDSSYFNVYLADKNGINLTHKHNLDLGFPYMILAHYLADIKKEVLTVGNLVYAGKLMGLCSYGKVNQEWLPHFETFYEKFRYTGDAYAGGAEKARVAVPALFKSIGVEFDDANSRYEGQVAWDIAATTQAAFENVFLKYATRTLEEFQNLPVCLAGGCALNVLLNTKLLEMRSGNVFIPPNTNDCGISVGALMWYLAPSSQVDLTYSGLPVLDADRLSEYIEDGDFQVVRDVTLTELAIYLNEGHIVGIIEGDSEHGSRALGHRSILCDPVAGMKDTLNKKVKDREWYRPFAPMVRLEDANTYFHFERGESRHMTFVGTVRDEWKSTLPAITHEDGTGRLQTVTRAQNEFIYDLLGEFEKQSGHAVLLNTSFNVNGKPILTRLSDAFEMLKKTKLDAVYYQNNLIFRGREASSFISIREGSPETETGTADVHKVDFNVFVFETPQTVMDKCYRAMALHLKSKGIVPHFMTDAVNAAILEKALKDVPHSIEIVGEPRHYYKNLTMIPDAASTRDHSQLLRLLWAKESVRDRAMVGMQQIFVNGPMVQTEKIDQLLEDVENHVRSERDTVFIQKQPAKSARKSRAFHHKLPAFRLVPSIMYGSRDAVVWAFDYYEAIMMGYLKDGVQMVEEDYLTAAFVDHPTRFKLI